jgi:outer membrane protein assembly factor BamC
VNFFRITLLLILVAPLLACSGSSLDRRYLDVELGKPLDLPPDLTQTKTQSSFDLPKAFSGDDPSERKRVPVLARVDSLHLQGRYGFYWLSVDEPVENIYQQIKNFWASEGYALVLDEPVIGIMQTEWVFRQEGGRKKSDSWWANLFASNELADTQDQFRTRIERDESGNASRIYITHRASEYVQQIQVGKRDEQYSGDNGWQLRRSDPDLEVEMLSRLMIYLGLQQDAVDAQVAKVRLFKPRASLQLDAQEKSPYLIINDPYQIAWNRVRHVLEVMNFDIEVADFKSGFSGEGVFIIKARVVENGTGKGIFSFTSSEELKTRKFTLVLAEETHELTRLVIEDQKGNFDTTPAGAELVSLLYEQIK